MPAPMAKPNILEVIAVGHIDRIIAAAEPAFKISACEAPERAHAKAIRVGGGRPANVGTQDP
jgi:hypothetical protein